VEREHGASVVHAGGLPRPAKPARHTRHAREARRRDALDRALLEILSSGGV
jgi:hypothetical protein